LGIQQTITKPFNKFVPSSKGLIQNALTGVGFDQLAKALDGVVGSPVQSIFSFQVPILGPVGIIDVINYFLHARNKLISRDGFIAVGAAKFVGGALPAIGGIAIPSVGNVGVSASSPVASGVQGAAI